MGLRVAVVGATGAVGREILQCLAEREFPADGGIPPHRVVLGTEALLRFLEVDLREGERRLGRGGAELSLGTITIFFIDDSATDRITRLICESARNRSASASRAFTKAKRASSYFSSP